MCMPKIMSHEYLYSKRQGKPLLLYKKIPKCLVVHKVPSSSNGSFLSGIKPAVLSKVEDAEVRFHRNLSSSTR